MYGYGVHKKKFELFLTEHVLERLGQQTVTFKSAIFLLLTQNTIKAVTHQLLVFDSFTSQ